MSTVQSSPDRVTDDQIAAILCDPELLRKQKHPESFISNYSNLAVKHRFGLATALELLATRAENEALEIVRNSASAILSSELENDGSSTSIRARDARDAFERKLVWGKLRDAFQGQPEEPLDTSVSLRDVASQSRSQASDALHEALSNHLGLTLPPTRATAACEVSQMDGPELERQRATSQLILLRKAEAREQSNTASSATASGTSMPVHPSDIVASAASTSIELESDTVEHAGGVRRRHTDT
jgi:hypothetical protein